MIKIAYVIPTASVLETVVPLTIPVRAKTSYIRQDALITTKIIPVALLKFFTNIHPCLRTLFRHTIIAIFTSKTHFPSDIFIMCCCLISTEETIRTAICTHV